MSEPADPADSAKAALRAALFDYSHSPGKYQVALRQPQLLFASLRDVLQIAVGREGEAAAGVDREAASLRDAARFFIRTALLYPGADHYALLGLDRTAENADLKDRYRLMMRLLHPDFSGPGAGAWPADSAVRVNRAYDTLSSAVQRRAYDESLAQVHSAATAQSAEARRPRPMPQPADGDTRQSRFKTLAAVCALAGITLVVVSLFATGSSDTGHLVQRTRVQDESVKVAIQEPATLPLPKVVKSQEVLVQVRAVPALPPTKPSTPPVAAAPAVAQKQIELPRPPSNQILARPSQDASLPLRPPVASEPRLERVVQIARGPQVNQALPLPLPLQPETKPEIVAIAASAVVPPPPQPAPVIATAPPVQAAPPPRPAPKPGPTLMDAQPLLAQLLQLMESGRGERILNLLDADARSKPSAQALSRQYDSMVDGARPVRVSHVEFKAEPGDGRLLVVGYLRVLAGEQTIGTLGKKMVLRAEFVSREGNVVITGLSGGPVN